MFALLIISLIILIIVIGWFIKRVVDIGVSAPNNYIELYNTLVTLKETALEAEKNVLILLQKRYNLILNLVKVVERAAQFEKDTLVDIAKARSAVLGAPTLENSVKSYTHFQKILAQVLVVTENYPKLRSHEQFSQLINIIIQCEREIADALTEYNLTVWNYNVVCNKFPYNIIAKKHRFTIMPYIHLEGEDQSLHLVIEKECTKPPSIKIK